MKFACCGFERRVCIEASTEALDLPLKDARASRDDARKQQQRGADPVLERQLERLSNRFDSNDTFEVIAQEFHATKMVGWSDHYAQRWLERLAKDVFPWLGKLPLPQIGAPMLLQTLEARRKPRSPRVAAHVARRMQPGFSLRRFDRTMRAQPGGRP